MKAAIIISASSDIGYALSQRWFAQGMRIFGTYRTSSQSTSRLLKSGVQLRRCDLSRRQSILNACSWLRHVCPQWDVLVLCAGLLDPICPFASTDFDLWEESVSVNLLGQLHIIHELLPTRHCNGGQEPIVLMFAGGGPNKATVNYSAYAVSKIALIKTCELLDAELLDTRFVALNPGWVKTKIHQTTLKAGERAGENYTRTIEKLASDECTPLQRILECCDWLVQAPRKLVSGRYFGVVFDQWGSEAFIQKLAEDPNRCKLRRYE